MAVAKQWEQTFVNAIVSSLWDKQNSITESSIYNKQSKESYQNGLVCGLPGP